MIWHVKSYHITSYIISHHIIYIIYPTLPSLTYPTVPYPILSYLILSYPILPYPALSYPILPYPILSHPIPSHLITYHITSHHITSHHIIYIIIHCLNMTENSNVRVVWSMNDVSCRLSRQIWTDWCSEAIPMYRIYQFSCRRTLLTHNYGICKINDDMNYPLKCCCQCTDVEAMLITYNVVYNSSTVQQEIWHHLL